MLYPSTWWHIVYLSASSVMSVYVYMSRWVCVCVCACFIIQNKWLSTIVTIVVFLNKTGPRIIILWWKKETHSKHRYLSIHTMKETRRLETHCDTLIGRWRSCIVTTVCVCVCVFLCACACVCVEQRVIFYVEIGLKMVILVVTL